MTPLRYKIAHIRVHQQSPDLMQRLNEQELDDIYAILPPPLITFQEWQQSLGVEAAPACQVEPDETDEEWQERSFNHFLAMHKAQEEGRTNSEFVKVEIVQEPDVKESA